MEKIYRKYFNENIPYFTKLLYKSIRKFQKKEQMTSITPEKRKE